MTFTDFEEKSCFFLKEKPTFPKKPKFRSLSEVLLFQWHSMANLLYFANKIFQVQNRTFRSDIIN